MTCEIDRTFLFGAIFGLICGGVIWGFIEAWWKDRHDRFDFIKYFLVYCAQWVVGVCLLWAIIVLAGWAWRWLV